MLLAIALITIDPSIVVKAGVPPAGGKANSS
jgi:hypothetical protein